VSCCFGAGPVSNGRRSDVQNYKTVTSTAGYACRAGVNPSAWMHYNNTLDTQANATHTIQFLKSSADDARTPPLRTNERMCSRIGHPWVRATFSNFQ
jgi:hypothetical protein